VDLHHYIDIFFTSFRDYANYFYSEITTLRWNNYFYWLIGVSLFFFLLEWWRPWRKNQFVIKQDFWLDVFYMFFNFFLFSLIGYYAISNVFVEGFNQLLASFGIRNTVAFEIDSWPGWAQLLTLFIVRDFIHWNVHRLLHRVPFLWEFHKVHHSAHQLGFATHLRFHWMETVVYRTLEYIPLGMIGFGIQEFFFVHIIATSIGHFNHSNIWVPLGPLKYVFNNPQMHAWHHAKDFPEPHRYGVNYGISLSLWDYLFRTAYIPHNGRDIQLGYPGDEDMPHGFWKQALFPFTRQKREEVIAAQMNTTGIAESKPEPAEP
jgi:sterol desaturase/sphingolipid hydroxylase (fatty acid hydroxylase superfamily)